MKFNPIIWNWLPFAITITLMSGLVYVAVQQDFRQAANDPQIQMAEDTAAAISNGQSASSIAALASPVDMANSVAPFLLVFDESGKAFSSNVVLDGKIPVPPSGVFDNVRKHGEERVTWQPKPGVRIAAVITRTGGVQSGFVLAGRSLREVEARVNKLTLQVLAVWILALILTFAWSFITVFREPLLPKS